ncbi:MAG: hypothetical protein KatS3mg043_1584 [Rhodothermaceae bacterium]|nr:MAG: hypothetical protein KatS3mg043_1584 [Rhodothermaceae bacterium]
MMRRVATILLAFLFALPGPSAVRAAGVAERPEPVVRTAPPETFVLYQNYPNPFNGETLIRYELRRAARVRLTVYDMLGRKVAELVRAEQPPGFYEARWDGSAESGHAVPNGMYLYRLQVGQESAVRTMLLLR